MGIEVCEALEQVKIGKRILGMYELFYNFTAEPFRLSPDHRFCFEHKSYGKARAYMAYAFKRAEGFVMITGRPGTGKTTLIGELVESLSRDKVVTANLVCTQLQADDLLKTVAYNFGISPAQVGKAELLQRLNILLHRWHREGRRALLVVDEAQDLSSSAMEELRLLTNIQFGGQPLLQIFLLGQPELRDLILSPEMEQVHQRIVAASHIEGLEADETEAYVIHRLSVVGWQGNPAIDRAIFPFIHRFSEGVPRRINLICSRLFLLGSVEERDVIGVADVRVVIGELQAENLAAGTGISQADFHSNAEPQWVTVPVSESRVPQIPLQQAVNNAPFAAAEERLTDLPVNTKKKDIPRLDPLVKSVPDSESGIPSVPLARFEFVPEEDLHTNQSSSNEMVFPHDSLVASNDGGSLVASIGGLVEAFTPRRRLIAMTFLMIVAIALILLLKACFATQDSLSYRMPGQRVPVEDGQALPATVVGGDLVPAANLSQTTGSRSSNRVTQNPHISTALASGQLRTVDKVRLAARPDSMAEPDAPLSRSATDIPDGQQDQTPIIAKAQRLTVPVATAAAPDDISLDEALQENNQSGRNEAAAPDTSSSEDRDSLSAETAQGQDRHETILISFPFDSDALIPDSHLALDRAAAMLREDSSSVAAITGFTDSKGGTQYNLTLSRRRAGAVERYLVDAGIARERLHVEGRGVLTNPVEGQISGEKDSMEPYRIVQIKLGRDG